MFCHPKSAASLFLASLTLLVTSTPLPVDATDTDVGLRQLTYKNFNTSIARDTWYVRTAESQWCGLRVAVVAGSGQLGPTYAVIYHIYHRTSNHDG